MVNIKVNEFKIQLEGIEYTFRLDFNALIKFNERFSGVSNKEEVKEEAKEEVKEEAKEEAKDAMAIFNRFLQGKDVYGCIVKILSCACVEKEFTEEELKHSLSFDFKTMKLMDEITFALVQGILSDEKDKPKEKN